MKTRNRCILFAVLVLTTTGLLPGQLLASVKVEPANCIISVPPKARIGKVKAAEELQKHLQLVSGKTIEIIKGDPQEATQYSFYIGKAPRKQRQPLKPEEARYYVTPTATYFYGDDQSSRDGTLYSIYSFLENQLGVRWLKPGDCGIVYKKQPVLTLTLEEFSWNPKLCQRIIRPGIKPKKQLKYKDSLAAFTPFQKTLKEYNQLANDIVQWKKRMRMGKHKNIRYGHAFTKWWQTYGKDHPDYFAINKFGKREPESAKTIDKLTANPVWANQKACKSIKLCVTNPKVVDQIISNWLNSKRPSDYVNVCENDSPPSGFCSCEDCRKLDTLKDGEVFGEYAVHLTDRYVYLANQVARAAKKHNPNAQVVMYAYNETEQPPRTRKLDSNVVVGVVPTTLNLKTLETLYEGWRKSGAKAIFIRPNYYFYFFTSTLPMGFEKQMYDSFQVGYKNGAIATDYCSFRHNWPVTGFANYVLSKTFAEPDQPFSHWENHYCQGYGNATEDVKDYYRYWREELWDKRLAPNIDLIAKKGRYFNFARGLMWSLGDYYTLDDFEKTDKILAKAAKKELSPSERKQLNELILANKHARLVFQAIATKGAAKYQHSLNLLNFRKKHKNDLHFPWMGVFGTEARYGDISGIRTAELLKSFALPWKPTALSWRFKLDPENVGLKQNWQQLDWQQTKDWGKIRTDNFWENPYKADKYLSKKMQKILQKYDGIGWYSTQLYIPEDWKNRNIYLCFGAVDESCWIYVNGKLAGTHLFKKRTDWSTPFNIEIGPFINWKLDKQVITVRVEDKSGSGGIWKRVWLVSKHAQTDSANKQ